MPQLLTAAFRLSINPRTAKMQVVIIGQYPVR